MGPYLYINPTIDKVKVTLCFLTAERMELAYGKKSCSVKNSKVDILNEEKLFVLNINKDGESSRLSRIRLLNMKMGVTDEMVEHSVKTPGEKHLEMIEKSEVLRKHKMREMIRDPVMSQIKRGKLGVDNFFILFGIFGSFMIPLYVYNKFRKNREAIVNSRIASPEVIKRLDEDSPISLEDVTYHTIHYYNPDRIKEEEARRKKIEELYKLERQLYF